MQVQVHSVNVEQVPVTATLPGGRTVDALVEALVVEFVGARRSYTFDFLPDSAGEMEALRARYVVGASFTLNIGDAA